MALALPEADLVELERAVIADRRPKYNSMRPCYNNGGWEHREETKQAQSQRTKALWEDPDYVERQRQTMLTYDGKTQSLGAWADETGVSKSTIVARLNRGWSIEQALNLRPSPPGGRKAQTYEFEGAQRTISEIAELVGASTTTVRTAIEEGRDPRYRKRGDRLEKRGPKATYYEVDGESKTLKEWAEELGVKEARMLYVVRDRGEGAHAAVERFVRDMRVVKKLTEKSA